MTHPQPLLGLDIGGTKIGVSIGGPDGSVWANERFPNDPALGADAHLERALAIGERLLDACGRGPAVALGAACPGPLSYAEGKLLEVPNMPRWQHFPILSFLRERIDVPVGMRNDANASVHAEVLWGAARGADTAIYLTMSTGMGAGLWLGGRLFEGPLALAGEIGHLRLSEEGPVGFGKRGSVEGFLSGPGMVQVARAEGLARTQRGEPTALSDPDRTLDARELCALARAGDAGARAALARVAHQLGRLCAWLVDLFNPDVIVMGTIGSAHPELFIPGARAVIDAEALPAAAAHVRLLPSALSDRSSQAALAVARELVAEG